MGLPLTKRTDVAGLHACTAPACRERPGARTATCGLPIVRPLLLGQFARRRWVDAKVAADHPTAGAHRWSAMRIASSIGIANRTDAAHRAPGSGVHADHLPRVSTSPPGCRVDGHRSAARGDVGAGLALFGADDAGGDRAVRPDGDPIPSPFANAQAAHVADRDDQQAGGLDLEQGHVGAFVGPRSEPGTRAGPPASPHVARALDDVGIRHTQAVGADHESEPSPRPVVARRRQAASKRRLRRASPGRSAVRMLTTAGATRSIRSTVREGQPWAADGTLRRSGRLARRLEHRRRSGARGKLVRTDRRADLLVVSGSCRAAPPRCPTGGLDRLRFNNASAASN